MIDVEPVMSLSTFIIGFLALLLIARAGVEVYVYYSEKKKKSPSNRGNDRTSRRTTNEAVRRYYNTYRKGA